LRHRPLLIFSIGYLALIFKL